MTNPKKMTYRGGFRVLGILFATALGLLLLTATATAESTTDGVKADNSKQGRGVEICHRPPGNTDNCSTITVGAPSVRAHMAHGDGVGACSDACEGTGGAESDPPAEEPPPEETAESDPPPAEDPPADDPPDGEDGVSPFGLTAGTGACAHLFEDGRPDPGFYVMATGNLDSDENYAFFYRGATITPDCRIVGPPAVLQEDALE